MTKYVSAVECAEKISEKFGIHLGDLVDVFAEIPAADVVPIPDVDETLEDLLTEFDEFGMQPTILVPDPEGMAIKWKRELECAIGRLKAEVAREIFGEINAIKKEYASGDIDDNEFYIRLYQLEKKYTEGEK